MFAVERYVTSALLAVLDQYVEDLDPKNAQVSLWTGGVALHNLVLRPNVVRRALSLPVVVSSGRIHELLVSVPWMKIVSEPVVVTINTMECVLSLDEEPAEEAPSPADQSENIEANERAIEEMPPGYVAALVQRVVSNITVRVNRLILKLVEDDTVLSLNIESLQLNSADAKWNPAFLDVEVSGVMRRIVHLRDLTLCLDRCSAAGTIRDYQEPLLYRCDLLFQVTRERSTTRTACTHIALECDKLLFGVSRAQLPMLDRLVTALAAKRAVSAAREEALARSRSQSTQLQLHLDESAGNGQSEEGWSAWAWSWVPGWGSSDDIGAAGRPGALHARGPTRTSLLFTVVVHILTFSFKISESGEGGAQARRMRGVLRLCLQRAALAFRSRNTVEHSVVSVRVGARGVRVQSEGACACGKRPALEYETYVRSLEVPEDGSDLWPTRTSCGLEVEEDNEADEAGRACPSLLFRYLRDIRHYQTPTSDAELKQDEEETKGEGLDVDECQMDMRLGEMELIVCAGIMHRLRTLSDVYFPPRAQQDAEEELTSANNPLRQVKFSWRRPRLSLMSLDHSPTSHHPLYLRLEVSDIVGELSEPLYRQKQSSMVSSHRRMVLEVYDMRALLSCTPCNTADAAQQCAIGGKGGCLQSRASIARLTTRLSATLLLPLGTDTKDTAEKVLAAYTLRIKEAGVCGSAARLRAAWLLLSNAVASLPSASAKSSQNTRLVSQSLAHEALNDKDGVHLDTVVEEALVRTYHTCCVHTFIVVLEGLRATVLRATPQNTIEQAWIFSAPDMTTTSPFLRAALQYSERPNVGAPQFVGVWCEPASASLDPLMVAWFAGWNIARNNVRPPDPAPPPEKGTPASSSQHSHLHKRSDALSRSHSSGERETPPPPPPRQPTPSPKLRGEWLLDGLRGLCASTDLGPLTVYMPTETVSALDCPSLHSAMERHVTSHPDTIDPVIAFSVGRLTAHSNSSSNAIWRAIRQDGPTIMSLDSELLAMCVRDSFPWKLHVVDASCYSLTTPRSSDEASSAANSRLKYATHNHTILERLSSGLTLSVINDHDCGKPHNEMSKDDAEKIQQFTTGSDFKPKTLREFVRGPAKESREEESSPKVEPEITKRGQGRMLGICVHMDTSPVIIELRCTQISSLSSTLHSICHMLELLKHSPVTPSHRSAPTRPSLPQPAGLHSTTASHSAEWIRATTEPSGLGGSSAMADQSDLIEEKHQNDWRITVWVQWVLARLSIRYRVGTDKLILDIEELSVSFDLQKDYCQYKVKASSAEVSVMERGTDNRWRCTNEAGARVLRARDSTPTSTAKGILALTVTAATSTSIRSKWSYDLSIPPVPIETMGRNARAHARKKVYTVWEVALRLAPLEITLNVDLLSRFLCAFASALRTWAANSGLCASPPRAKTVSQRPLIYFDWSGVQIALPVSAVMGHERTYHEVVLFEIQHITINPNPENPICRQPLRPDVSAAQGVCAWWEHTTDRQYSIVMYGVAIYTAAWQQIEGARAAAEVANDNPARAWRAVGGAPAPTPLLHPAPLHAVLAPGTVLFAAATEVSLPEDVHIHICRPQIQLLLQIATDALTTLQRVKEATLPAGGTEADECMYYATSTMDATHSSNARRATDSGCCCSSTKEEATAFASNPTQVGAMKDETDGNGEVYLTARALHVHLYELGERKAAALLHARLTQPTVFVSRRTAASPSTNTTTKYQVSLYNLWVGCARDCVDSPQPKLLTAVHELTQQSLPDVEACPLALLDTGRGTPDPVTHVRPALLTLDAQSDTLGGTGRVRVRAALERPVRLQICEERARRIYDLRLLMSKTSDVAEPKEEKHEEETETKNDDGNQSTALEQLHERLCRLENVEISTQQVMVRLASSAQENENEGVVLGLISCEAQLCARLRPNSILLRALVTSLAASAPSDSTEENNCDRIYLLHPLSFGLQTTVIWEPWRRSLSDASSDNSYAVRTLLEGGCITIEAAPCHINLLKNTLRRCKAVMQTALQPLVPTDVQAASKVVVEAQSPPLPHFFKDDLRNGAFKVSRETRDSVATLLAYQVIISQDCVMWRYPQPRTLTRVLIYPLPLISSEVGAEQQSVALEWFCEVTGQFQQLGYLTLHETNPAEFFASVHKYCWSETWRVRLCAQSEHDAGAPSPHHTAATFDPVAYSLSSTTSLSIPYVGKMCDRESGITHALTGALRVDSCQSERSVARLGVTVKIMALDVRVCASANRDSSVLMMRRSRTAVKLFTTDMVLHLRLAPLATTVAAQLCLRAFLLEPSTMQTQLVVGPAELRALILCRSDGGRVRAHFDELPVSVAPHHLQLLKRLYQQWIDTIQGNDHSKEQQQDEREWVRYWLQNKTERALYLGQESTREACLLKSGEQLAYAWRSSRAPRRLCLAITDNPPSTGAELDTQGRKVVTLENNAAAVGSMRIYVSVSPQGCGALHVPLTGRLHIANALSCSFHYKVRTTGDARGSPRTVCVGSVPAQSADCTVLCPDSLPDRLFIKLKMADWDGGGNNSGGGWTGDVPLRECPDGKAPWLVKVPCRGEHEFVCVWGRTVSGAPPEGRLLLMLWPLYVVNSELPLELMMKATSETPSTKQIVETQEQAVRGRGATTPIMLPGTTHTSHRLTFRYRDVETRVTRDSVPLQYSLATELVLEKPVAPDIDLLLSEVCTWLRRQSRADASVETDGDGREVEVEPAWPYSAVTRHRAGEWIASPLPPHTLFMVQYKRVRAGGAGCALELQMQPHGLFCNAATVPVTVRSRDFLHLCTTQPGHVVAPPHNFPLEDGWTVSLEPEKDVRWLSIGISVARQPRGVYEHGPPGELSQDRPAHLYILSPTREQVALLSLYYELRRGMGIVGVSTTHLVRNLTSDHIQVCGIAIWSRSADKAGESDDSDSKDVPMRLSPREYLTVPPHAVNGREGYPLYIFNTQTAAEYIDASGACGHWRKYICLKMQADEDPEETSYVPVRLDADGLSRRTVALRTADHTYRQYCVTVQRQQKEMDGRTVIEVGEERHAEFLVRNSTNIPLLLGANTLGDGREEAEKECAGALWQRSLQPNATLAYSTPSYSAWIARSDPDVPRPKPILLLSACNLSCDIQWGRVEVGGDGSGALLVRVSQDVHVKVSVQRRARDTSLTVHHVAPHDVSARDIRQRLQSGVPASLADTTLSLCSTDLPSMYFDVTPSEDSLEAEPTCCTPPLLTQEEWACEDALESPERAFEWSCRLAVGRATLQLRESREHTAILAVYLDSLALAIVERDQSTQLQISVSELQADNPQSICNNSFDFPVLLAGHEDKDDGLTEVARPPLWAVEVPPADAALSRLIVDLSMRSYTFNDHKYIELCQMEVRARQMAVYLEDRYLVALLSYMELLRAAPRPDVAATAGAALVPTHTAECAMQMRNPLRVRLLRLQQLPLLLSLHTSTWLYIALDHSPLTLAEYERRELATRPVQLLRSLAYHYLSGAIFGAGWVVGGLEALGAPGTLVRRVGEGVRALAAGGGATALCGSLAAGALESLAALCNSFARNLDLLAGDEAHRVRAEAQRRRRPRSLASALATGLYNLASSLVGSVGGLALNSLAAPRAALVGAVTRPISATADLVALSSQGLLSQAGWDLRPQPRAVVEFSSGAYGTGDEVVTVGGERAVYVCRVNVHGHACPLLLLFTTERLILLGDDEEAVECIELSLCEVKEPPAAAGLNAHPAADVRAVHVEVKQPPPPAPPLRRPQPDAEDDADVDEQPDYEARAAALARVARYTGAADGRAPRRTLRLSAPSAAHAHLLRAHLTALLRRPEPPLRIL